MISNFKKSKLYQEKVNKLIPGGAHTYSKGDDQFPENSPRAMKSGKGAYLTDLDGNEYLDTTMGLASISLGHAYDEIIEVVKSEIDFGVNFQKPSYIELEVAEKFLSLLPTHDMIKFAKNGSTVTTAAVKLARAKTGRKMVAFPYDHPFYSYDDWFIGSTECKSGIPEEISNLSVTFKSCSIDSLKALFDKYPNQIACIITEPEKNTCGNTCNCKISPQVFLKRAIDLCHENGALFILDEMQSGFRTSFPGSMTKYDIIPDMATWGKGIANGFSFCALTGIREVMELGSIYNIGKEKVFLISTTHGAETHTARAAIKTIEVFQSQNVIEHNHGIGRLVIEQTTNLIKSKNLEDFVEVVRCEWYPAFNFYNTKGESDLSIKTLMMQEMIKNGIMFQGFFLPCFSHTKEDIHIFSKAFSSSLDILKNAIETGVDKYLIGNSIKPVFRKLN
tara:strand:+ start:4603 stop:5946 length:1344 start_codon:yes stop_codon:yes gene_type:complete